MSAGSLKLEDVQLLSDEISWLVKSGLPLEHHLANAGRGHGRKLRDLTESIAEGLKRGESLEGLIRSEAPDAPRMLTSAIAAGIRSGNLADSVEMMGDLAGDLIDLRRQIIQALSYPLTVVACAWVLFVLLLQQCLTRIWTAMQSLRVETHPLLAALLEFNDTWWWWPWVIPGIAAVLLLFWLVSGRAAAMALRGPERALLMLPGVGGLLRDLRFCTLSRMLAFLLERGLPLPAALRSAGACCGSGALDDACSRMAATVEKGEPMSRLSPHRWMAGQLPPMLQAALSCGDRGDPRFIMRVRAVGEQYQARLELSALWLRMLMPVVLFCVIAGGTVVAYSVSVFWPMTELFRHLGN